MAPARGELIEVANGQGTWLDAQVHVLSPRGDEFSWVVSYATGGLTMGRSKVANEGQTWRRKAVS